MRTTTLTTAAISKRDFQSSIIFLSLPSEVPHKGELYVTISRAAIEQNLPSASSRNQT